MNENPLILAIDQGTTSSRAIVFDRNGQAIASAQYEFTQYYPDDGWVEHDPEEIWSTTVRACREAIADSMTHGNIIAAGITNQRETTVVWDRETGKPVYNAIVWQDRRTSERCASLKQSDPELENRITEKTGLLLDPYFSATKIAWILDHVEGARQQAENGQLAFGTIDTFLIWRLSGGSHHLTDATNASRTMLFNIHSGQWDDDLLTQFNIPEALMPRVLNCAADYGRIDSALFDLDIPVCGVAGDQQAALVGQACFDQGMIKSTYGTGCFMILNTGEQAIRSNHNLLTTIGYQLDGKVTYALEGSIFNAGTTVQWLRDEMGILGSTTEIDGYLSEITDNEGVYMVPAFTGMGAPHWDPDARGIITGITRGTRPAHFVRAAIESVCYQTYDLIDAMLKDGNLTLSELRVDGGMVVNNWMLQFLSDILQVNVSRPVTTETTALGAFYLAGIQVGLFDSTAQISEQWQQDRLFSPAVDNEHRKVQLAGWQKALQRCLG